tara:strand:- start:639 stop:1109 length:471 start_codon:yes stop_codon:yes gene_type:complete
MPETVITTVVSGCDLVAARELFAEYGEDVSRAHCLKNFVSELDGLPGEYGPPRGALFLARVDGSAAGAVGLRCLDNRAAEMKRLYVRPHWQGLGLGRQLTVAAINQARDLGYSALRLDTLGHMTAAQALYADLGFVEIAPYHPDTACGMRFMELGW